METHTSPGIEWKKLYSTTTTSAVSTIEITGLSLKKNTKITILIQNDTGPEGTSDMLLYLNNIGGDPTSEWWTAVISASTASSTVSRIMREASFFGRIHQLGKFYIYITIEYTGPTVIIETRIESMKGSTTYLWRGTLRFKPSGAGEDYDITDIKIVSADYDFPSGTEIVIWGWC